MRGKRGFVLLTVVLTLSVLAMLAIWLNRETGMRAARESLQNDVDRARYIAEAGLVALHTKMVQTKRCDGTLASTPFGSGSFEATTPNVTTNFVLQATGIYSQNTVTIEASDKKAVLAGQDTYLDVTDKETYHGVATTMDISSNSNRFFWISFDLPTPPAGKVLDAAILCLRTRAKNSNKDTVVGSVYRATQPWTYKATWTKWDVDPDNPTCCDWTSPGGDFDATVWATDSADPNANDYWLDFDLTALVGDWATGVYPNQGVRVALTDNNSQMELITRNHNNAAWRPRLRLEYRLP